MLLIDICIYNLCPFFISAQLRVHVQELPYHLPILAQQKNTGIRGSGDTPLRHFFYDHVRGVLVQLAHVDHFGRLHLARCSSGCNASKSTIPQKGTKKQDLENIPPFRTAPLHYKSTACRYNMWSQYHSHATSPSTDCYATNGDWYFIQRYVLFQLLLTQRLACNQSKLPCSERRTYKIVTSFADITFTALPYSPANLLPPPSDSP